MAEELPTFRKSSCHIFAILSQESSSLTANCRMILVTLWQESCSLTANLYDIANFMAGELHTGRQRVVYTFINLHVRPLYLNMIAHRLSSHKLAYDIGNFMTAKLHTYGKSSHHIFATLLQESSSLTANCRMISLTLWQESCTPAGRELCTHSLTSMCVLSIWTWLHTDCLVINLHMISVTLWQESCTLTANRLVIYLQLYYRRFPHSGELLTHGKLSYDIGNFMTGELHTGRQRVAYSLTCMCVLSIRTRLAPRNAADCPWTLSPSLQHT